MIWFQWTYPRYAVNIFIFSAYLTARNFRRFTFWRFTTTSCSLQNNVSHISKYFPSVETVRYIRNNGSYLNKMNINNINDSMMKNKCILLCYWVKNDIYSIYPYLHFPKRSFYEKDIFERICLGFQVNAISSEKQNIRKICMYFMKVLSCKDVCDTFYDHFAHQKWTQYPAKACVTKIKIEACEMNSILI